MRLWIRVLQRLGMALIRARVPVLFVLVLAVGVTDYLLWRSQAATTASAVGVYPIEMSVVDLAQTGDSAARLTLREKNGSRRIAMSVGINEALAIAQNQNQQRVPGLSQGYQLTQTLVQQLGGRVERVMVYDATGSEYFAHLVLTAPSGGQQVVAFRPAEAVTLAITSGAPVFVEDRVLTQYGQR